jgi:transmembrane sensor
MSESDMARFKAWRAEHPSHREAFDAARKLWQRAAEVESVFAAPRQPPSRRGARMIAAIGLVAACLVLAVSYDDLKMAVLADYATATGARRTVRLTDGSVAYLNTDTAIAVDFSEGERRIDLLEGEAYFEVAHDAERPFRVRALHGATQAVGTAFAVRENGPRVIVSVSQGTVSVTSPERRAGPTTATILAHAGEQVAYREGEAPRAMGSIAVADTAPWRDGRIVIDGLPFAQAIAELNRYRRGRIVLLGDATRYRPVSGVFSLNGLDEALDGLAATQGLTVTRLTDYLLVLH